MTVSNTEHRVAGAEERSATLAQYTSSYGYSAAGTALGANSGRKRSARTSRIGTILAGTILPVLLLLTWWALSASGAVPAHRLPSPTSVWQAAVDMTADGALGTHIAISTQRVLLGFVIGSVVGLILGSTVGLSRFANLLLAPTIGGFRAVPSLAWVPLLVMYVGINEDSKVTLVAIGAMFPVYTTVSGALRHVDAHLVELGRTYGLGRLQLLRQVQLPAIIPSVVSGLRLALAQSWLFLVAGELLGAAMGLGFLLTDSSNNGRLDRLFLTILLLAVLGKTTDALVGLLERNLLKRWG